MTIQSDLYQANGSPGLAVTAFFTGKSPSQNQFDALSAFVAQQESYAATHGVPDVTLAGYQAVGEGFAASIDTGIGSYKFFGDAYLKAFGRAATFEQTTHFVDQQAYFESIGLGAAAARGAALGELLGVAVAEQGTTFAKYVGNFYAAGADGTTSYDQPIDSYKPDTITVVKEVPGPTVYVPYPVEPPHVVDAVHLGTLDITSTKNFDGQTQSNGAGNFVTHFLFTTDHTSNNEFGLQIHYRTGDYVDPVQQADGSWVVTMEAGHQKGPDHNQQGENLSRSKATADVSMNFGLSSPQAGQFKLTVEGHDYTLQGAGANWGFADAQGNVVQGLTLSADGHVLQDSINFGFGTYSYLPHTSANSGDLAPQDIHVSLSEMVGTVAVATVSETIHLV